MADPSALHLRPITFRAASAFVRQHHRHNKPPRGHKFSISVWIGDLLVGVAQIGRPVSRHLDDGLTFEVNRTCTLPDRARLSNGHVDGANSKLYGAAWRASRAMGYRRGITYTQGDEDGRSLRAAGWRKVAELDARGSWAEDSVELASMRDPIGNGGVPRVRWEIP